MIQYIIYLQVNQQILTESHSMPVTALDKEAELLSGALGHLATLTFPTTVHSDQCTKQESNYSYLT